MTGQACDPLAARSLAAIGGPLGRHVSARSRGWTVLVVPLVALVSLTMALAVVERGYCITHGWNGSDQFWRACFSDLPVQYQSGHLSGGLTAYLESGASGAHLDQPVVTGALMSLVGGLTSGGSVLTQTRWYFVLWALIATVLLMATVWLTAASRPRHLGDAAQVALSPVLVMAAVLSADVVGVALTSGALFAWSRRRRILAGILLGLAVMARTYPLLVLLALALLALRTGRWRAGLTVAGSALATAVVVALPFLILRAGSVSDPYAAWWRIPAGLGSPWQVPSLLGLSLPVGGVTTLAIAGWVVALCTGALVALGTPRRPSVAEVAFVLVALVLVTGKTFPVQSSLWLVPLVALCGLRWRDHLVWAGAEGMHFVAVWLYVGGLSRPDRGLPAGWYAVFLLIRVAAILYLVWRVCRQAQGRPEHEPQEASADRGEAAPPGEPRHPDTDRDEVVDELAGDFAESHDRLLVRIG